MQEEDPNNSIGKYQSSPMPKYEGDIESNPKQIPTSVDTKT